MCIRDRSWGKYDIWTKKIILFPAGFEPATLCVWSTRDNHYTKETHILQGENCNWYLALGYKVIANQKYFPSHLGIEPRTFGLEVQRAILCANGTPHDKNTFLPNMIHRKITFVKCSEISFCFSTQYSFSKKLKKGKKDSARAGARTLDR